MIGYSRVRTAIQAIRVVLCAFVVIGKARDFSALRPQHVIIAGLICAVMLVTGVITVVNIVAN